MAATTNTLAVATRTHLRTEELVPVKVAPDEVAVFPGGDDALSLDAEAARSAQDFTAHVIFLSVRLAGLAAFRAQLARQHIA